MWDMGDGGVLTSLPGSRRVAPSQGVISLGCSHTFREKQVAQTQCKHLGLSPKKCNICIKVKKCPLNKTIKEVINRAGGTWLWDTHPINSPSSVTMFQSSWHCPLPGTKRKLLSAEISPCENVILILSERLLENAGKRERGRERLGFPGASVWAPGPNSAWS